MRLSIIIPVFNAGTYLQPLLDRLSALPDVDIEFVLVDDGSSDQSLATLALWVAKEPRAKLIEQANSGVAAARNRGLQQANGEYVWFVDADDLPVVAAIATLVTATESKPDVITFNGEKFVDGQASAPFADGAPNRQLIYHASKPTQPVAGSAWLHTLLKQKELRHFVWLHWCRREYLQSIGLEFLVGISHEDVAWVTEVTLRAKQLQYVDVCAYQYRLNSASATGSVNDDRLMRRIKSYFTVVKQLRAINVALAKSAPHQVELSVLLRGEVVGQALQIFEVAKLLNDESTRAEVVAMCRAHRLAQALWCDALNFKRQRQVLVMWWRQQFGSLRS